MEYCECLFDEGDIGTRLGGGGDHIQIILLDVCHSARLETYSLISARPKTHAEQRTHFIKSSTYRLTNGSVSAKIVS